MFKTGLCFTVIILCSLMGIIKSFKYSDRVRELEDYITALRELEAEMSYRLTPLQDILAQLSDSITHRQSNAFKFFGITATNLTSGMDMAQAWQTALQQECSMATALTTADISIISELGTGLGYTGIAYQQSRFNHALDKLQGQLGQAKQEAAGKGSMYKKMGVMTGITAAILII